ncbi:MAG TPA: threonylcarbamoyl-AMP synthase [Methylococcaceae bacterium]|jgi:tRNA threonylcarbamoyl adenosine modification protein (Sua5/YciO/YrdC/YwlC family)|nr:threonylcarbamoyl-AMP synthase [Methylococcaceae bacterium]HIA44983.1 threonylcarbamoyl-AMP synthase [Methylococcaceae bacterium]HIN67949.1 threonylcarbamoyl-AMP synthase [Methylococcales bacterium]HIO12477.1 threonylcarbamoyl-AMP synthase [Methylococcales bacterium]HIO43914.1 threonylcarbamoyl-AMP synthase [Methylococcales bacterium]
MAQFFSIHPENPQLRLIQRAVDIIRSGGVIAYPTDSSYAIGCQLESRSALNRICAIRQLREKHNFTLMCKDLAQVASFGKMDNDAFRLIKALTPGPFTFVLKATKEVPRQLQHVKRKTIGVRLPDHRVADRLLNEFNEPIFSSTLILPGDQTSITDPQEIRERLEKKVDLVIDSGIIEYAPTTIIAFLEGGAEIIRQGKGVAPMLGAS